MNLLPSKKLAVLDQSLAQLRDRAPRLSLSALSQLRKTYLESSHDALWNNGTAIAVNYYNECYLIVDAELRLRYRDGTRVPSYMY